MPPPRSRTLPEWLQHIQCQHWRSVDMQLQRVATVWARLKARKAPYVVSIAGTNGKGSCVAMLEAICLAAGVKTASYTSPHLVRYNERFLIQGVAVTDAALCDAFCRIEAARQTIPLTYFEFSTLCALVLFAQAEVDVALLEVGLGGRLDAVNIVDNDIALITSIGIDHARWLGNTKPAIASEKAGIIKPNAVAVVAENHAADPAVDAVLVGAARAQNATLLRLGREFTYRLAAAPPTRAAAASDHLDWQAEHTAWPNTWPNTWRTLKHVPIPLGGKHQADNLSGVLAVAGLLSNKLPLAAAKTAAALSQTRLAGRCQLVQSAPLVVLDVAHNADSARRLSEFLQTHPVSGKTHAVVGVLHDKPLAEIFTPLRALVDCWYFAGLSGERGQSGAQLRHGFAQLASNAADQQPDSRPCQPAFDQPVLAYQAAMRAAQAQDRVVVFGSFYTVGDIIAYRQCHSPS